MVDIVSEILHISSFWLTIFLFASAPVAIIISSRNIILFLLSLLFFVYVPFVIPLYFIIRNGSDYHALFLWSSTLHLIVLSIFIFYEIIVFYREKKKGFFRKNLNYFINLIIVLSIFSMTFSSAYVERYISTWESKNRIDTRHSFQKVEDNLSIEMQNKVRKIIDKALVSKYKKPENTLSSVLFDKWKPKDKAWQEVNITRLEVDKIEFSTLRKVLMQKPSIEYTYYTTRNDTHGLVLVSSKERPLLRVIVRFSLKDRVYVEELITKTDFNLTKRSIFGDTKATQLKETHDNRAISAFYKEEFERSMQDFIEAKSEYEVFKSRVEYRFALLCIERFDEDYLGLDYRENLMDRRGSGKNKKVLSNVYDAKVFIRIEHIQNQVLGTLKYSECKKYKDVESLYKVFIKKYLTRIMFTLYSDEGKFDKILKKDPIYDEMEYNRKKRDYLRGYVIREVSQLYKRITGKSRKSRIRGSYIMTNESYFTYTNTYLSREEIKALLDNQELLDFIETQDEIIIRDRFLDTVKRDKYTLEMAKKFKYREYIKKMRQLEKVTPIF